MQDEIIKQTGDSRYLKSSLAAGTTWDAALSQLRAGTFPIDLNGKNAGGIAQQGTDLNKANLLSDETAQRLGLDPSATPDDAFALLSEMERIGDIKITARADMDEAWYLCNGQKIDSAEYPELCGILKGVGRLFFDTSDAWVWNGINHETYNTINAIAYGNGYWVVGGQYYTNSTCYARIAYAKSHAGPWTVKDLWSSSGAVEINAIAYGNGYWVAAGGQYSGSTNYATVAYATTPGGSWSTRNLWGANVNTELYAIAYADGYWVAGGEYCATTGSVGCIARIAYATTPSGTWTTEDLWGGANASYRCFVRSVTYADGYWAVSGIYYGGPTYIAYATEPSGTWTNAMLWNSTNNSAEYNAIAYGNGYWVVGGWYYSGNSNEKGYARIAYSESLAGPWTIKDLWGGTTTTNSCGITGVICVNGLWIICGGHFEGNTYYARCATAEDITGEWLITDMSSSSSNKEGAKGIAYCDGTIAICGKHRIDNDFYMRVFYNQGTDGILDYAAPVISVDDAYAYIRVK